MSIGIRRVATIKYPANALFALFTTRGGGVEHAYSKPFGAIGKFRLVRETFQEQKRGVKNA